MNQIALLISITFVCFSFVTNTSYWIGLALAPLISVCLLKVDIKLLFHVFFISFLTLLPVTINAINYDLDVGLFYWFGLTLSIFLGWNISRISPIKPIFSAIPLIALFGYFSLEVIRGVEVSSWLPNNSENFISVSLILAYIAFNFLSKKKDVDHMDIVFSSIILFFCLVAIGRGGIITGGIIFLGNILLFTHSFFKNKSFLLKFFLFFVFVLIIILSSYELISMLLNNGLLNRLVDKGLESNARLYIYAQYITHVYDNIHIIIGLPSEELPSIVRYNYNLHSSYFNIHSKFGLGFLLYFLIFSIVSFFIVLRNKCYWLHFFPLLALYLRAATDIQMFAGRADWVFFTMLFTFVQSRRESNEIC